MLNQKFWDKYFKTYDVLNKAIPYQDLLNDIIEEAKIQKGDLIFDAGSGTGNLAILLKEKGARVIGLDFSEAGIRIHKQKDNQAEIVHGDISEKLPFEDNYFDKIVSNNVIYAIPKEKRELVFKEFYRILKPGGLIVIANVHKGFKPLAIFIDHLKRSLKKFGFFKTLKDLIVLGFSTLKIFYYNYKIKKEHKTGSYDFMYKGEQKDYLSRAGFKNSFDEKLVYSSQGFLAKALKK